MLLRAFGGTWNSHNLFGAPFVVKLIVIFPFFFRSLLRNRCFPHLEPFRVEFELPSWPSDLKNVGFMKAGARFSNNQGFGSKDALDGVLGLSWAHFGCSWGLLEGSFGVFAGFRWHLACSKLLLGLPSWPNLLSFFCICFRSLLRSHCFPHLGASSCRF